MFSLEPNRTTNKWIMTNKQYRWQRNAPIISVLGQDWLTNSTGIKFYHRVIALASAIHHNQLHLFTPVTFTTQLLLRNSHNNDIHNISS